MLFPWSMRPLPASFFLQGGEGESIPLPRPCFPFRLQPDPPPLARKLDRRLVNELPLLVLVDLGRQVRTVVARGERDLGSQPARIEILQRLQGILHPPDVVRILVLVLGDLLDELHSGDLVAVYRRGLEAENAIGCIPRDLDQVFVVATDVHEELRLEAALLGVLEDARSRGGGAADPTE